MPQKDILGMPNFKISLNRARTLIFNKSAEGKKSNLKSLKELLPYIGQKNVTNPNGRIVMSLATGRSGQRWLSRVVNEDNDWVGSCERLKEYEYLLRWLSFNNLRGDRYYEVIDLIRAAAYRDISVAGNSYIASPYFSFSVSDLIHKINPSLFVWQIRDPIEVIQSLYTKGFYKELNSDTHAHSWIDLSNSFSRNLSRLIPYEERDKEFFNKSGRIGRIAWYWARQNNEIHKSLKNAKVKTQKVNLNSFKNNYNEYEEFCEVLDIIRPLSPRHLQKINATKTDNKGHKHTYKYKDWSSSEKAEFNWVTENIFHFDEFENF